MSATWQSDVSDFMGAVEQCVEVTPQLIDSATRHLREALISEECDELYEAMDECDLCGIADALADLLYVTIGTACAYGIDLGPIWDAVHAANMAKIGGEKSADGKCLKPDGWQSPDIAGLLKAQGAEL